MDRTARGRVDIVPCIPFAMGDKILAPARASGTSRVTAT
jgi:hypothetical protein